MTQAGWARWGKTRIDLLMNAQVDSSVRLAQLLVGEPRFLRVNTMTTPGMYALDGSKEIEDLVALGNRKGSDPEILSQVRSRSLNGISAMDCKSNDQNVAYPSPFYWRSLGEGKIHGVIGCKPLQ